MTAPDVGALVSTGGAVLIIVAWAIAAVLLALFVGKVISLGDHDDEADAMRDERQAQSDLYGLRSFERRTDYVVPRERSKW